MKKIELLSPAGSYKSAITAIQAGADALYLGVRDIAHQRSSCTNFSNKELKKLSTTYPNIKLFVTFNSSYNNKNTNSIIDKISKINNYIDGIIISDIGLILKTKKKYKQLKIIFSVQGQCLNSEFAIELKKLGVDRIVLDRNITLKEAISIKKKTGLEIEIFGFGYQCYSQDSICYLGDYFYKEPCCIVCAQKVKIHNKTKRHLFMKYYSILPYIPEIIDANIDSIKIEGRQRSSKYTYDTTTVFREAIDHHVSNQRPSKTKQKEWKKKLDKATFGLEITKSQLCSDYKRKVMTHSTTKNKFLYLIDCITDYTDSFNLKKFKKMITSVTTRNFEKPK